MGLSWYVFVLQTAGNGVVMTYELANLLFYYDSESGKLYNRIRRRLAKANSEAGCIVTTADGNTYRCVTYRNKRYLVHRIVWLLCKGKLPDNQIDHKDGNGLNNKLDNLRDVSNLINGMNQKKTARNTSGVMGVHWAKENNKWRVRISVNRKRVDLGL